MSIEEFDEIDPEDTEAACELFDRIKANAAQLSSVIGITMEHLVSEGYLPSKETIEDARKYLIEKCPEAVSWRQRVNSELKNCDAPICLQCNGSGEGMYDGSRCSACGGSGHEKLPEDSSDIDVDDYWN